MRTRAGFTLLETMIALALIGLVLTKLTLVMDQARRAHEQESTAMELDDQAMQLIDRISFAVVGSAVAQLAAINVAPLTSTQISYQLSLGVENGKPVWGDPELILLDEDHGQIKWEQNPGEVNERAVVWANSVADMLQDELLNGIDDNQNGLADELGLNFTLDGKSIEIRLTLERTQADGKKTQVTKGTTVTCRN